jgi:hypothetical protein
LFPSLLLFLFSAHLLLGQQGTPRHALGNRSENSAAKLLVA